MDLRAPPLLLLLVTCAAAPSSRAAPMSLADQRVAVLEFQEAPGVTLQAPEALTDACRGEVVKALKPTGALVLTRENMLEVLKATGGMCKEGECEVETARNLGVGYFITGYVARIDGKFVLTLKAYETRRGQLLAQAPVITDGELALLEKIRSATRTLLAEAFGLRSGAPTSTGPAPVAEGRFGEDAPDMAVDSTVEVVVAFESEPAGATVRLDGALLCQATPCSKRVAEGPHEVVFEKERYAAATLNAVAKKGASVRGRLVPTFGVVTVQTEPPGVAVTMNGESAGASPARREVDAGPLEVVVDDRCFLRAGERLNVKAGDVRAVTLPLKPRQAALKVVARDEAGNDVEGEVLLDGVAVGDVGAMLRVPVCGKELTVRGAAGEWAGALAVTEGRATTVEAVLGDSAGKTRPEPKTGATWVWMPKGKFHYGCEPQDTQCENDEKPGRTEQVEGFWMMQTEVTIGAYNKCKSAGACRNGSSGEAAHPVTNVDHDDAKRFCAWVDGRLPTAVEWEYAATSGSSRVYPWGDAPPDGTRANCAGCGDRFSGTSPVGSFPGGDTPWGLKDVAGNVWEWTASSYGSSYIEIRGGSWHGDPSDLRAGGRDGDVPDDRSTTSVFVAPSSVQVCTES